MKEFKISCPHCQQHIAFPENNVGQVIACPACGLSVGLNVPGYAPQKKSHGVFYYVFWGVISLIVTGFILCAVWVVFLGGLVAVPAFIHARDDARQRAAQSGALPLGVQTNETTAERRADLMRVLTNETAVAESAYIKTHLVLYDFNAKFYDSILDGRVPGVEFKIKNNGTKTLKKVGVTVCFYDSSHATIYDETFYPVWVTEYGTDNEPLKPGYIWQQEQGRFYSAKKVPSEWVPGSATAKITDIEFAE